MSHDYTSSGIHFPAEQYEKLRQTYRKWWANDLGRPIVPIVTVGHPTSKTPSQYPLISFANSWDLSISPEQFIQAQDYDFSTMRWHGDAFPFLQMDVFGPGVMAAFLGCTPQNTPSTVWFHPPEKDIPIEQLHFEYDENNPYLRRVLNFYEAAMEKWHGQIVLGMADLGGILDVLSSFRGTQNLLLDLYDAPEEVTRCVQELQQLWFVYFDKINEIMAAEAQGYSHWFRVYSENPSYILQSDFSYMIGRNMFDEFVAPELSSSADRLYQAVYHMDGIGEIPHLESLLAIDGIKGIQWIPGAGEPMTRNWDELVSKILDSGKKLIAWNQNDDGSPLAVVKDPGQLHYVERRYSLQDLNEAKRYADMYNIEITL